MDAEAFDYSLAFNSTCSSSSVFSVPWEEQWYTAAWGVAGMSVATGECLSVCLCPPSRPHHSFPLQQLSFHFDVGTFSGPKHWTVHKAGRMSLLLLLLGFNIVWSLELSLSFIRSSVIVLDYCVFAFEGHFIEAALSVWSEVHLLRTWSRPEQKQIHLYWKIYCNRTYVFKT